MRIYTHYINNSSLDRPDIWALGLQIFVKTWISWKLCSPRKQSADSLNRTSADEEFVVQYLLYVVEKICQTQGPTENNSKSLHRPGLVSNNSKHILSILRSAFFYFFMYAILNICPQIFCLKVKIFCATYTLSGCQAGHWAFILMTVRTSSP